MDILQKAIDRGLTPPASETEKTPDRSFNRDLHKAIRSAEEKNLEPPLRHIGKGVLNIVQIINFLKHLNLLANKRKSLQQDLIIFIDSYETCRIGYGLQN